MGRSGARPRATERSLGDGATPGSSFTPLAKRRSGREQLGLARAGGLSVATINQRASAPTLDAVSSTELLRQVMAETKELVVVEARLAKDEVLADVRQLESAAILGGVALTFALLAFSALVMALVLALGATALVALMVAAVLLLVASVAGGLAYGRLPKPLLARTRERLETDVRQIERHI